MAVESRRQDTVPLMEMLEADSKSTVRHAACRWCWELTTRARADQSAGAARATLAVASGPMEAAKEECSLLDPRALRGEGSVSRRRKMRVL